MGLEEFLYALKRHRRVPIVVFLLAMLAITFVLATHEEKAPRFRSTFQVAVTDITAPPPELLLQVVSDPAGNLTYVLSDTVESAAGVDDANYVLTTIRRLPNGNDEGGGGDTGISFQVDANDPATAFDVATRIGNEYIEQRAAALDLAVNQRVADARDALDRIDEEIANLEQQTTMKLEDVLDVDDSGGFIYPLNVIIPAPVVTPAVLYDPATPRTAAPP